MYKWEERYSVGIQSIDKQHKEVFNLLNNLLQALKLGQAGNVTTQIILELEKYAAMHFQKEEFFFQRFNYSGAEQHIREHQLFIQKITELKAAIKDSKIAPAFELFNFLKEWIEHHILVVDKEYRECFLKNGLR
ncbi:MAG TPA: bacteriohemerythrin [Prolixibacteraceae bacterium]|nr:bacteriohemerythrin [Prolixibacteraceae bacterium]